MGGWLACDFKGRFLEFQIYHSFVDFFLNVSITFGTTKLISFTNHIKQEALDKAFCEEFPNSATHTS